MADAPETASSRRRRIARRIAVGLVLAGAGAYVGGHVARILTERKFLKTLSESNDWVSLGDLKRQGKLPFGSTVIRGRVRPDNSLKGRIMRFLTRGGFKPTHDTEAAYSIANAFGTPVFFLGSNLDKLNDRVSRHEFGHHKALKLRRRPIDYVNESMQARERGGGWLDLFNPGRKRFRDGSLTTVGIENEAWDLAGVPAGDKLREAALGTYKADAAIRSLNRYAYLSEIAGVGAGAYGFIDPGDDKKNGVKVVNGIPPELKAQLADGRAVINR